MDALSDPLDDPLRGPSSFVPFRQQTLESQLLNDGSDSGVDFCHELGLVVPYFGRAAENRRQERIQVRGFGENVAG
jgi:hypothetical protein